MNVDKIKILTGDYQIEEFEKIEDLEEALNYFKDNITIDVYFKDITPNDYLDDSVAGEHTGEYFRFINTRIGSTTLMYSSKSKYFEGTFNKLYHFFSTKYMSLSEFKSSVKLNNTNPVQYKEGLKIAGQLNDWLQDMLEDGK